MTAVLSAAKSIVMRSGIKSFSSWRLGHTFGERFFLVLWGPRKKTWSHVLFRASPPVFFVVNITNVKPSSASRFCASDVVTPQAHGGDPLLAVPRLSDRRVRLGELGVRGVRRHHQNVSASDVEGFDCECFRHLDQRIIALFEVKKMMVDGI